MRETIGTKLGFLCPEVWRNFFPFFHHSCPVPDVLLTHWERHHLRNTRKTEAHRIDQAGLMIFTSSSLTGKSSALLRRPAPGDDKPKTQHFMNTVMETFGLCNVINTRILPRGSGLLHKDIIFSPVESYIFKNIWSSLVTLVWITLHHFMVNNTLSAKNCERIPDDKFVVQHTSDDLWPSSGFI